MQTMDIIQKWLQNNIDIVFFFYGLAFVLMGVSILMRSRTGSRFMLADHLWLLAWFGLIHGANEWLDMWAIIKGSGKTLDLIRWGCLVISYIFIFEFGRRFFKVTSWATVRHLGWWLSPVIIFLILIMGVMSSDFFKTGSIFARYFLGFPGALLSGLAFFAYYRKEKEMLKPLNVKSSFILAGVSFITYGVLSGLIVPRGDFFPSNYLNTESFFMNIHIPVQLFRALTAITSASAICIILGIFNWETTEKLQTALNEMEEKTAYLDNILYSSTNIAIAATDRDFCIKYYNPVAEEIFGYKAKEVIGRTVMEMHTKEKVEPARFEKAIEVVKKEGEYRYVVEQKRNDGIRIIESRVSGIWDKSNNLIGFVLMSTDVTERKKMERELQELNIDLEKRVAEEIEKRKQQEQILIQQSRLAAMGEMINAIAHNWRQPLNAMGLIIQGIKDTYEFGGLTKNYIDESVEKSMKQLQFMSRTIDVFRNFFRHGRQKSSFDVKLAIGEVLSILSAQLKGNNISYRLTCRAHNRTSEDFSEIVQCDEMTITGYKTELEQAIFNILNNAADAIVGRMCGRMPDKDGKGLIDIDVSRESNKVVIRISDNGGGIPEKIIGRIFEPYFSTREEGKGTGIGLYMAKVIIENNMGGRIYAENIKGGTMFTIELSLTPSEEGSNCER